MSLIDSLRVPALPPALRGGSVETRPLTTGCAPPASRRVTLHPWLHSVAPSGRRASLPRSSARRPTWRCPPGEPSYWSIGATGTCTPASVGEARLRRTSRFGEPGAPGPNGETGARSPSDQAFSNGRHGRPSCRTPPWHPHRSTIEIRNILLDVPAGTVYVRYTAGRAPARPRERPAGPQRRNVRTVLRTATGMERAALVTWSPGGLVASLPRCLIASLPHCLEASLPSQKRRTRIEPNFPPWRYRKRDLC